MTKLRRLIKEASESATWRGHKLRHFRTTDYDVRKVAISTCTVCEKFVAVNTNPRPNQVDIGGEAVALGCKS